METEILVHVSAPSGNDARYHTQVAAILRFQSASRQLVTNGNPSDRPENDHQMQLAPVASVHPRELPNSREAAFSTLSSPDPDHPDPRPGRFPNTAPDSLGSLISVIPDSQPEELPGLTSALPPPPYPAPEYFSPLNQDSPGRKCHRVEQSCSPNDANGAAQTTSSLSTKEQPAIKPIARSEVNSRGQSLPNRQTVSASKQTPAPATSISLNSLPLELHPPPPPISTAQFTTHITPTLSMLADRLKPPRTYKPIHQARVLDNLERGHWVLQINILNENEEHHTQKQKQSRNRNDWPAEMFHRFWTFLADFIADGRAGWGVWCILEYTPSPHSPDSVPCSQVRGDLPHSTPVILKMYAWGEVAMHVYLLLFLASERRVRGMGALWRDAREDAVIVMP